MASKQIPDSTNGYWSLFLLGYSKDNVRKALILNEVTKKTLNARVSVKEDKTKTDYIVIEAVDPEKNLLVDFAKTFTVLNQQR